MTQSALLYLPSSVFILCISFYHGGNFFATLVEYKHPKFVNAYKQHLILSV